MIFWKRNEIYSLHVFLIKRTMWHCRHSILGHSLRCCGNVEMKDFTLVWLQWTWLRLEWMSSSVHPFIASNTRVDLHVWKLIGSLKECIMARCPQCPMEIWERRACTFPCLLQDFFHFVKNHGICIKLWQIFLKGLFDKLLWTHFAIFLRTVFADWWMRCRAFLQARQHITSTFRGWEKSLLPIHLGWPSYFAKSVWRTLHSEIVKSVCCSI